MMGMRNVVLISGLTFVLIVFSVAVTVFFVYVAYLLMKALKIYIRKNSEWDGRAGRNLPE